MSAAAALLLNGFPPAAGATALTSIYLNQMGNSINNKKNMYDKVFLYIIDRISDYLSAMRLCSYCQYMCDKN